VALQGSWISLADACVKEVTVSIARTGWRDLAVETLLGRVPNAEALAATCLC